MKIGIVGAMAQEVEILSQLMTDKKETKVASAVIFEGKINGKEIALFNLGLVKSRQLLVPQLYYNWLNRMWF